MQTHYNNARFRLDKGDESRAHLIVALPGMRLLSASGIIPIDSPQTKEPLTLSNFGWGVDP